MTARNYHHGDLRAALIDAALVLIAERETDDLSLREVARRVGVSATAVYRHFPDKRALMAALAGEGRLRLGSAQREAYDAAGGGKAGFSATGAAYVRFALDNPALFRLAFATSNAADLLPAPDSTPDDAMTFLLENATALAPAHIDARVFALQCWSLAHGLAMLMLDGQVPEDDAKVRAVLDAQMNAVL